MAATEPTAVVPPSPAYLGEAVENAIKGLLKWKDCQPNSEKPQLLSSDDFVYLVVTVKKIPPKSRTNPYKIPLIHPLFSPAGDGSELCLFLDDRPDRLPTSKDAKAKIASESIPIPKVIKLSKLKTDYKPFEAKRKLCDSYDLFLADRRIIPLLPKHIGKHFFKKKKIPVAVDLEHQNWKEQVERVCSSAFLHLKTGTCSTLRVARSSMAPGDIVQNVVAAINGVAETVPKKWSNLRSLHLKLSNSLALPIYQSLPEANLNINGLLKEAALAEVSAAVVAEGKKRGREGEDVLSSKKSPKASSKKGRIHQVRYMDDAIDKVVSEERDVVDEKKNDVVKIKKAKKKETSKAELVEADGGKKKRVKKEASTNELVEADGENGEKKKKKLKKESTKDELVEADGGKKKKVRKESSKDELVEADGGKKKKVRKESSKDELVEADGGKKKKVRKHSTNDELVEGDGAKKKKAVELEADGANKKEARKDNLVKADGANLKKENKVRKVSNVTKSGSAKKSKRN